MFVSGLTATIRPLDPQSDTETFREYQRALTVYLAGHGLDSDTVDAYSNFLFAAQAANSYMEEHVLRRFGLSLGSWRVLLGLALGGPAEPGVLGRALFVSTASVVTVLNTLSKAGLVQRSPHPDDRRKVLATITPAGVALFERIIPANIQAQRELLGGLTQSDLRHLDEISDRIATTARALRGPRR